MNHGDVASIFQQDINSISWETDNEKKLAAIDQLWKMTVGQIEQLLKSGMDPNAVDINNQTVLHILYCEFFSVSDYNRTGTASYCLSRVTRLFVKAGFHLDQTDGNDGKTLYEMIENDTEMAAFLGPSLRKNLDRLDSLAANAVPSTWIPHLNREAIDYPSALIEKIKQNLCV